MIWIYRPWGINYEAFSKPKLQYQGSEWILKVGYNYFAFPNLAKACDAIRVNMVVVY